MNSSHSRLALPKVSKPVTYTKPTIASSKAAKITREVSSASQLPARKPLVKKEIPMVTWKDFSGVPKKDSYWLAYTTYFVRYSFRPVTLKGKPPTLHLTVTCTLNPKTSWVKWKDDLLLEHEQGHYLIGWISALTFKQRVLEANLAINGNLSTEIQKIYKETMREFALWQRIYDEETEHYLDQEMQDKWNEKIKSTLDSLKCYL